MYLYVLPLSLPASFMGLEVKTCAARVSPVRSEGAPLKANPAVRPKNKLAIREVYILTCNK